MDPSPAFGVTVQMGDIELSWDNIDPNHPGAPVSVEVWFGTDPNKLGPLYQIVGAMDVTGESRSSVVVNVAETGKYYWQVDTDNGGESIVTGDVFEFYVTNDLPPVDVRAGVDMITWANQPVQLGGTYVDDGTSPVDVTWSSDNAGAVFSPSNDGGVTSNDPNPTVTVDNAAGAVTLTFTVQDGLNPAVSDDMIVTVYADPCQAARAGAGLGADYPGDLTGPDGIADCVINLADFAAVASEWLSNYALADPVSLP